MTPDKLKETQQYIDFVKTNLEPLAAHLKVGVDWLWNVLVNQVRVEAIVYLLVIIMLTVKSTILLIVAFKSLKKAKFKKGYGANIRYYTNKKTQRKIDSLTDDWDNKKDYELTEIPNVTNMQGYLVYFCGGLGVTMAVVSSIFAAVSLPKIITGLVNPEYGAIERVVEFSKGKIPSQGSK